MRDHRRVCLGRAVDRRTGEEAAAICVINFDGGDVCMIPVSVMLDDPGAFAERFTMDPGEHPARRN